MELEVETEAALDAERQLVLTLGGFSLEIAGAVLVLHEKIPVPRFNYVHVVDVGRERQAAFFERALDHYFQRALRPTFRAASPVPEHIDRGLRSFGFRAKPAPLVLLLGQRAPTVVPDPQFEVREPARAEMGSVAAFWTGEKERPELVSALDVAQHHPNSRERLLPLLATRGGEPVSAAVVYRYRSSVGIHLVTTRPFARGQGGATALVGHVLRHQPPRHRGPVLDPIGLPRRRRAPRRAGVRAVRDVRRVRAPARCRARVPLARASRTPAVAAPEDG